jgi:hypothetical protein
VEVRKSPPVATVCAVLYRSKITIFGFERLREQAILRVRAARICCGRARIRRTCIQRRERAVLASKTQQARELHP